ncbi:hypothetical protein GJAV_G00242930 [Gymnothorax javanicus]|nr:hypothetical protein GJAV_G00242930 [Gymnothorax javanicus]
MSATKDRRVRFSLRMLIGQAHQEAVRQVLRSRRGREDLHSGSGAAATVRTKTGGQRHGSPPAGVHPGRPLHSALLLTLISGTSQDLKITSSPCHHLSIKHQHDKVYSTMPQLQSSPLGHWLPTQDLPLGGC